MIKKRNMANGINANVSLEPTSAASSNSNISNNIYITRKVQGDETEKELETVPEEITITRNVEIEENKQEESLDVKLIILETYAKILLTQDKALLSNLISKNCIIVPFTSLQEIIKTMIKADVEIYIDEDIKCCASKASPIRKVEAIKIIRDNGEIVTDFKTVYNKEYNELVNIYHLCLKYVVNQ
mgnify:CR=1 FL=1